MRELDAGRRALRMDEFHDARQWRNLLVFPQPEIARRNPPARLDARGLCDHQPGPTDGAAAQMHHVPVIRKPVVARVLAHRRHDDSVAELHASDFKR
jgi:hypothetical protein